MRNQPRRWPTHDRVAGEEQGKQGSPPPDTDPMNEPREQGLAGYGDDGDIARNLDAIEVIEQRQTVMSLRPWLLFEKVPRNNQDKKRAYLALRAANRALCKARAQMAQAERGGLPRAMDDARRNLAEQERRMSAAVERMKVLIRTSIWAGDELAQRYEAHAQELAQRIAVLESTLGSAPDGPEQAPFSAVDATMAAQLHALRYELARVAAVRAEHAGDIDAYVEGLCYEEVPVERSVYRITVDGEAVSLRDHVDAYATVYERGLTGHAVRERTPSRARRKGGTCSVIERIEALELGSSVKKILRTIAEHEGGFTTVNTYDRAVLTWGFLQWTGGAYSDLTRTLAMIAALAPDAFERRFRRYGIDVERRRLVLWDPAPWHFLGTGGEPLPQRLVGEDAARRIGQDPILMAVLVRAGLDEDIQHGQIRAAIRRKIDRMRAWPVTVRVAAFPWLADRCETRRVRQRGVIATLPVTIGDIVTSEYGVGVLADRAVHGGEHGAARAVSMQVEAHLLTHGLDPLDTGSWTGTIEPHLWSAIIAGWTDRAQRFLDNGASQEPGSFER